MGMGIFNLNLKGFFEKIKKNKKLEFAIYAAIILLAVLVYVSGIKPKEVKSEQSSQKAAAAVQTESIEDKLKRTLEKIEGAGEVEVMVSYATSGEIVPALSVDKQTGETTQTESTKPMTVQQDGGEEPMILYEKQPQVLGVIIVAQGAQDIRVQMDLQRAAQTVLGISASQVEVFAMNSAKGS